jgi:S-adenosylmethionine hydrolase
MGIIIDIDHFGNIITNHKIDHLKLTSVRLNIGSRSIEAFDITYRQTPKLVALIGSHGYLEVALAGGNAAKAIGANVGDLVELSVKAADLANSSLA